MKTGVVLCEGYYDRAFWSGWFERLGCPRHDRRKKVIDPLGRPVTGGHFGYCTLSDNFVRIVPCHGRTEILPEADRRLRARREEPFTRFVISVDPDTMAGAFDPKTGLRVADVERMVREHDAAAKRDENNDIQLADDSVVSLVRWEAGEPTAVGLPDQQCLERLVCAALATVYPARAPAVQTWLDGRPEQPSASPKEFSWSYMAGWYAEQGCDRFFRAIWEDEKVAAELEQRLRACGAWRIGEALVG